MLKLDRRALAAASLGDDVKNHSPDERPHDWLAGRAAGPGSGPDRFDRRPDTSKTDFAMHVEVFPGLVPMDTVLVHGNVASNNWWRPAVDAWRTSARPGDKGRLILGEWRGCGQSPAPASIEDLRPWNLADDYIAMLTELGVRKACFVGHSAGGLIGLYALARAPRLFERAVLLDPVSAAGLTGSQTGSAVFDRFAAMSRDREFLATILAGTIRDCDVRGPFFQNLVDDAFGIAPLNWRGVLEAFSGLELTAIGAAEDQAPRLNPDDIVQPVLVMHGEHDTVLPIEESVRLAERLANGKFLELKGRGHSANVETPELFVQLVSEFLYGTV